MYYTIYKITNNVNVNGKFYIGAHQTKHLDDGYMGSGYLIRYAIKKYGIISFTKEILFLFDNKQDMYNKERELVNESFVLSKSNYNLKIGGIGGFDTVDFHSEDHRSIMRANRLQTNQSLLEKYGEDWRSVLSEMGLENRTLAASKWRDENPEEAAKNAHKGMILALSESARTKRKETMKQNSHSQGEKNSQFGTMWINNSVENKKIKKDDPVPEGWNKGRLRK